MTIRPYRDRWERPRMADLQVLRAYAETGTVEGAASRLGLTVPAARKRLHRLYREHHVNGAPQAIWALRDELSDLGALDGSL